MTELLYYKDQYLTECDAKVVEVKEDGIVLDQTIFFGRSCGVKPDSGFLFYKGKEIYVSGLRKEDGKIIHIIESEKPPVGSRVHLKIDWERRYQMMKLHTTLHIVSAIVWRDYEILVTGSDISPQKAKIDFDMVRNFTKDELTSIENKLNQIIQEGHLTSSGEISLDEALATPGFIRTKTNILPKGITAVRFVKIGDIDKQADGGIHVDNTREIGGVKIVKQKNKGKGRRRIELELTRAP